MKPIGQTFYVNTPATGIPGVYITKVTVFFKNISPTYGIECQIRTTLNGVPTNERLPFGSKILYPSDMDTVNNVKALRASDNASAGSTFEFDTPVFVQGDTSYALVLIPLGGNPDYQIWTAEIGQTDVATGTPIYTNNDTGDLFLSSNDRDWIPVITEDMKFDVYIANFTSLSGTAVYRSPDEDYLELEDTIGSYIQGEPLYATSNVYNVAVLNISGLQGTFASGDYVYQTNATSNTAYGYVYAGNSSVIKLQNTTASFSSTKTLFNANSVSNAYVTSVSQNASITVSTNTFSVPDSGLFSTNDVIYIATSNYSKAHIVRITSITNNTTIAFSNAYAGTNAFSLFTDTNCIYGKIMNNGLLHAGLGSIMVMPDFTRIIMDSVTSTASNNFVNAIGQRLIGIYSGASAKIHDVINVPYNNISPSIAHIAPPNTGISWSFTGIRNTLLDSPSTSNFTVDSSAIPISEGTSNELIDYERLFMSRSKELTQMPVGRGGERSVKIFASMSSSNSYISPVIDNFTKFSNFTYNLCPENYDLSGFYLSVANVNGVFSNGSTVTQAGVSGILRFANSSYLRITNVSNGNFTANATSIVSGAANATIVISEYYDETLDNGFFRASRYISKNVILASDQNSEDILVFLGAYRPANTNLKVYTKLQNNQDSDKYENKEWSLLLERTPGSLLSSQVDQNDMVELSYGFPQSLNITTNSSVCSSSSNTINVASPYSTSDLAVGNFVYLYDANNAGTGISKFIVREIVNIPSANTIVVDPMPSFSSSNAAIGYIPGLQSQSGAFLNDRNNNVVRYVSNTDLVFDTYSQFSIKIVPISASTSIVPRVGDMRVLAVQA
jgi:hypothetical protein